MITAQKGTKDIYGEEMNKWHFVENAMREVFENAKEIDEIIVVITPDYRHFAEELILKNNYKNPFILSSSYVIILVDII